MPVTLSLRDRIACAAAVLLGRYGDVTRLARQHGLCRQAVYRHTGAVCDDLDGPRHRQDVLRLRQQCDQLQARCDDLQQRLAAAPLDDDRQAQFTAVAQAEGVSLPVARRLLQVALGRRPPSVAQLCRWGQGAARRCAPLLAALDEHTRPRVRQAVPDEIFVRRRPILMMVEPHSLCWVSGRRVEHRDGVTWAGELAQLPALEQVTKDAGSGLAKGLEQVNRQRRQEGRAAAVAQDDHFHVLRDGRRTLRVSAGQANRAVDRAWKADKKERKRCRGRRAGKRTGPASVVALRWRQAEAAYQHWCRQEQAWQQVAAAMTLFDASGQLQTRTRAEAAVAAALPELTGKSWAKTRAALARPELWTYLDRAQEQLAALPVAAELREAALQVEGARRRPGALAGSDVRSAALRGVVLLASVVLSRAGAAGVEALMRVRGVLGGVWRASSLVEGINSVLRMQQSRHRRLTQGLLDLKRLYWNCHPFRTGKRKRHSPYELLGVPLPAVPWWELLKWSPEQLRDYLSGSKQPGPVPDTGGSRIPAQATQQLSAPGVAA